MTNGIVLDERLSLIAQWIEPCACVADIGADHGRLGAYLLQKGKAQCVQFLDVSADSLSKARKLIHHLGLEDRAKFSVGDGAKALVCPADVVVIAGMGGQLIADIIEQGRAALQNSMLIVQPNVATMELRERAAGAGFRIQNEKIVRAAGRQYVIIAMRRGEAHYSPEELLIGPVLIKERTTEMMEYAARRVQIAKKALKGAQCADAPWTRELQWECECWEEMLHGGESFPNL